MPDVPNGTYNRNLDFLNTGMNNLVSPELHTQPMPNVPGAQVTPSPKEILSSIFDKVRTESAPWSSSLEINQPVRTPLEQTLRYQSPIYGFDPYNTNQEAQYGDRQSAWTTWGNNILKFLGNTTGSFAQAIVAVPQTLDALSSGDIDKTYNGKLANSIADMMENLEISHPTYQSTANQLHPIASWIPFTNGSANNWSTLLNNLGFTAGAIGGAIAEDAVVGVLTGGVGDVPLVSSQIMSAFGKIGKYFTAEKRVSTAVIESLDKADELLATINAANKTKNIVDKFRYGLAIGTSAIAEGTFEANQTYRNIEKNLTEDYRNTYHRDPSGYDLEQIKEYARGGGNAGMLANVALLTFTNSQIFGSLFSPTNAARKAVQSEVMSDADIALSKASMDVFENTLKNSTKFDLFKSAGKIARPITTSLTEGFEEGSQFVIQRTAEDYYKRKFSNKDIDTVDNFTQSLATGLKEVLTTREGLENVFLGILSGAVIHVGRGALERRKGIDGGKNQIINSAVSLLNSQRLSGLFRNTYDEAVVAQSIKSSMDEALAKGDIFEHKNLKFQQLFNFVESGVRANRFDLRMEQLNMLKELKPEEFQNMFGINFSEENKKTTDAFVDNIIKKAHDIKDNIDKVEKVFPNPYKKGTNNYFVFDEYKTQLGLNLSEINDNKRRLSKISTEIAQSTGANVDEVINLTNDKGVQDTINRFEKRVKEIDELTKDVEDKDSDLYKKQTKERDFLNKKVEELKDALADDYKGNYTKTATELLNYYANNKTFNNEKIINPIDAYDILNKAQDGFKLISATDGAIYHYQQLTNKNGYNKFFADVMAEYQRAEDNFDKSPFLDTEVKPGDVNGADVEDVVDEPAPKAAAATKATEAKPAETKKETKDVLVKNEGKTYIVKPNGEVTAVDKNGKEVKGKVSSKVKAEVTKKAQAQRAENKNKATDIEAKKADIEKRRQEELNEYKDKDASKVEEFTFTNDDGDITYVQIRTYPDGKRMAYQGIEKNKYGNVNDNSPFEISKEQTTEDYLKVAYSQTSFGKYSKTGERTGEESSLNAYSKKINAKYDAELATLEENTSKEVQTSAGPVTFIDNTPTHETFDSEDVAEIQEGVKEADKKRKGVKTNSIQMVANPSVLFNKINSVNYQDGQKNNDNLRKVLFSKTPQQIYDGLTATVAESTKGLPHGAYQGFKNIPGVYYTGSHTQIELKFEGETIGFLSDADRLYFKRGEKYTPLIEIAPEEYERITGNEPSTYSDFIQQMTDYKALSEHFYSQFKSGKTEFTNQELKALFDIVTSYGGINYSKSESSSTLLKNLTYKGQKGSAILSFPVVYNKENKQYERSTKPTILNKAELSQDEITDIVTYVANNLKNIQSFDRRYLYVMKMPDGTFRHLVARPSAADEKVLNEVYNELKNLPTTLTKAQVDKINSELTEKLYIADSRNRDERRTDLKLTVDTQGNIYLNVFNKTVDPENPIHKRVKVNEIKQAKDFDGMVRAIDEKIRKVSYETKSIDKLNLSLAKQDFKSGILNDAEVTQDQLNNSLSIAAQPDVFKQFSLRVFPLQKGQKAAVKPSAPTEAKQEVKPQPKQEPAAAKAVKQARIEEKKIQTPKEEFISIVRENLTDIKEPYKSGIAGSNDEDVFNAVVSQYIDNPEAGKNIFGKKVSDALVRLIPEAAEAEKRAFETVQVAADKKSMAKVMETLFSLKSTQAKAVSEIYDRVATTWALRNGKTKEDFYKSITFRKTTPESLQGSEDTIWQNPSIEQEKAQIKEAAKKNGTFRKAPNGKPSLLDEDTWLLTKTKAFKNWFGNSKVLDVNGEPMVMFHGTPENWSIFDKTQGRGMGLFLSPEYDFSEDYAMVTRGNNVLSLFVKANKPFDYENKQDLAFLKEHNKTIYSRLTGGEDENGNFYLSEEHNWQVLEDKAFQKLIKDNGYDGYYVKEQGIKNLAVYEADQVKDASGRNATFSTENPDIYYQYSNSAMIANVVKGFELQKAKSFGNLAFQTKNGKATPELAKKINKWLADNGYGNTLKFVYEATHGTVNPFINEGNLLFQNQSVESKLRIPVANILENISKIKNPTNFITDISKGLKVFRDGTEFVTEEEYKNQLISNFGRIVDYIDKETLSQFKQIFNLTDAEIEALNGITQQYDSIKVGLSGLWNRFNNGHGGLDKEATLTNIKIGSFVTRLRSILREFNVTDKDIENNSYEDKIINSPFVRDDNVHYILAEASLYKKLLKVDQTETFRKVQDISKLISNITSDEQKVIEDRLSNSIYNQLKNHLNIEGGTNTRTREDKYKGAIQLYNLVKNNLDSVTEDDFDSITEYLEFKNNIEAKLSEIKEQIKKLKNSEHRFTRLLKPTYSGRPEFSDNDLKRNDTSKIANWTNVQFNQGPKGAIRLLGDSQAIIYSLTNPDVSTPLHELAHYWEGQLTDTERADVLEWAGTEDWSRETSEKFARGFEKYLADGEAPTSTLQKLFDNFKKWLTDIYKGIVGSDIDVTLNDSMKKIYAAMLGEKYETVIKEEVKTEQEEEKKVEEAQAEEPAPVPTKAITRKELSIRTTGDGLVEIKHNGTLINTIDEFDGAWYDEAGDAIGLNKDEAIQSIIDKLNAGNTQEKEITPAQETETQQTEPVEQQTEEQPQPEEERIPEVFTKEDVGSKVMYNGKELTVTEVNEGLDKETPFGTVKGTTFVTITDGTKYGEQIVASDKLTKVAPEIQEETEEPFDEGVLKEIVIPKSYDTDYSENHKTEYGKQNEPFTVSTEDEDNLTVDYVGLKVILEHLKQKYNIPYQVVDVDEDWKGKFENSVAVINLSRVSRDTPFHEYLHPFMAVLKVDNHALYTSLMEEYKALVLENDDIAGEAMSETLKSPLYKGKNKEEIQDEALVNYLGKLGARNFDRTGRFLYDKYHKSGASLARKFFDWFVSVLSGFYGALKANVKGAKAGEQGVAKIKYLPAMNLAEFADLTSSNGMPFDFTERKDLITAVKAFQADATEKTDDQKLIERIKRRLAVLDDTARRRTPSPELLSELIAVRSLLKNYDEFESINQYIYQGIDGLRYASDEFKRISGKLSDKENKLTQKDVKQLHRDLDLVRNLLAMYEDVHGLFGRVAQDLAPEAYKAMQITLAEARNIADYKIKARSIDLTAEWLFPYIEEVNERIKDKYPSYVLTKEQFKNKLYNADEDLSFLQFHLGSVGSNNDPVSAITRTALFDVMEDNHLYEAKLGEEIKIDYAKFLKAKGLANETKSTVEYYKKNFLRKATILQKTEEKDDEGKFKWAYTQKWALHQPYFYDLYTKDKAAFLETLGEMPDAPSENSTAAERALYQNYVDKIFAWEEQNGSLSKPADKYKNAEFDRLYNKDEFFTKMYDTYKEGNDKYGEEERLQFGIVPQVFDKPSQIQDVKTAEGAGNKAKVVGNKVLNFFLPKAEESTTAQNDINLDGSMYKRIKTPYVQSIDDSNVSLVLPETIFKFAGAANLVEMMREVEPNVRTLRMVLEGNAQFKMEARKIIPVTSDRKTIFDRFLKLPSKKTTAERLNKQLLSWLDDVVYGQEELQDTARIFGRAVDLNKLGGNFAFLTALNNMAFNVTAGIGNVSIGNIMTLGESLGAKYYTPADWRKAQGQYFSNFNEFMKDAFNLKKSKITQLGIKYDAIQGEFRDKYGKKFVGNATQRYANADTIFIINHAAEHQIQLVGMLSLMNATKVKTTSGETISLFDAHKINEKGFLRLRDDIIWTAEDERLFTQRLHGVNKILNGNYSKFDKVQLQRTFYGKLMLIYRKFMYNAFRSRYGRQRFDYEIGDEMEGYYRKFFSKVASDIKEMKFNAAANFFNRKGWSADEKYAYNKTMFELSLLVGMGILTIALANASGDDKDKSWLQNTLTLQMLRLRKDIGMYSIFGATDIMQVLQNPSAVILTATRYTDFFTQLVTNPTEVYKRKTGAFDKGDSILKAKLFKAIPIVRQAVNMMQPEEQLQYYRLLNKY